KLLGPLKRLRDEAKAKLQEFGEATDTARTKQHLLTLEIGKLPAALRDYQPFFDKQVATLKQEAIAFAEQYDQKVADKKATEEAAKANQTAGNELAGLAEKIAQAREQLGQNTDATKLATTELDKFNRRVAEGKYAKVTDAQVLTDLKSS